MALFYLKHYRHRLAGMMIIFLCFCVTCFIFRGVLVLSDLDRETIWSALYILDRFIISAPFVLWIIAKHLFEGNWNIHPIILLIIGAVILIDTVIYWNYGPDDPYIGTIESGWNQFLSVLLIGFSLHVMIIAFNGREDDLVHARHSLRVPFTLGLGGIITITIALIFTLLNIDPELADELRLYVNILNCSLIFIFVLAINLATAEISNEPAASLMFDLDSRRVNNTKPVAKPYVDPIVLAKITNLMETEHLYTNSDLTIGDLAKIAAIQKHKLRKIINSELKYRNFCQFLNHYRILEAKKRLAVTHTPQESISNIAIDIGFSTLSSFNKSFKDITGKTPSGYRKTI